MAGALRGAGTETEARRVLERIAQEIEQDQRIADSVWQANAKTRMAGHLFVEDIEAPRARHELSRIALDRAPPPTFLNLPFAEAIEFFASRNLLSPEEFDELLDAERFRSFTVRRAISEGIIRRAFERIQAAFAGDGTGLGEFIEELEAGIDGGGFPGGARSYLEMVYRTNTATSYNAGRFAQQIQLADDDSLVWVYATAGDNRVRASHAALDGKAWPIGDDEARAVYPPNSFNCRCVIYVEDRGAVSDDALDRRVDGQGAITEGFRGAPGDAIADEAARAE